MDSKIEGSSEKIPFGTRFLALINLLCPACNIARRFPETLLGRMMTKHWEKGCPSHRAYLKVYKGERLRGSPSSPGDR